MNNPEKETLQVLSIYCVSSVVVGGPVTKIKETNLDLKFFAFESVQGFVVG